MLLVIEEYVEKLENWAITAVSGIFLLASFILSHKGIECIIDPAWVSFLLSGIPIIFSALKSLINGRGVARITSALLMTIAMIAAATPEKFRCDSAFRYHAQGSARDDR